MKKEILIALFVLISVFGYSQCRVINRDSGEGVAFAQIKVTNQPVGKLADIQGWFELGADLQNADSLLISCIGFEKRKIAVRSLNPNSKIELTPKTEELRAVDVSARKTRYRNKTIGVTKVSHSKYASIFTGKNGSERATRIPNEYSIPGYLKTIHVYVTDRGYPDAPFRIHVYACSYFETRPGDELTQSNIIASATRGKEWVSIDMSEQHIRIPENGCFIGIEWFDSPKAKHYSDTLVMNYKKYDHGSYKDTTFSRIREGNGMAMSSAEENYLEAKNKNWFREFYRQDTAQWKHYTFDESKFYEPDTLESGHIVTYNPKRFYLAVPSINIDIAFPKNKLKPEYEKPKIRKLKKLEKVKEDLVKYPQSNVNELMASSLKAFENNDIIYFLTWLCVFRDDQLDEILGYLNENIEETGEILPLENRMRAVAYLKDLNAAIDSTQLKKIEPGIFEFRFDDENFMVRVVDGAWRLNPYGYQTFDENNRPLIQLK